MISLGSSTSASSSYCWINVLRSELFAAEIFLIKTNLEQKRNQISVSYTELTVDDQLGDLFSLQFALFLFVATASSSSSFAHKWRHKFLIYNYKVWYLLIALGFLTEFEMKPKKKRNASSLLLLLIVIYLIDLSKWINIYQTHRHADEFRNRFAF